MGSTDFDELMDAKKACSAAEKRADLVEESLRKVIRHGTRGNCPPGHGCKKGVKGNCETCWLAFVGLSPLPVADERERRKLNAR